MDNAEAYCAGSATSSLAFSTINPPDPIEHGPRRMSRAAISFSERRSPPAMHLLVEHRRSIDFMQLTYLLRRQYSSGTERQFEPRSTARSLPMARLSELER
jgi:hypothetical protein